MEIKDYENYLIYPDGRVWSKKGKGKFMKSQDNGNGYFWVCLSKNNKVKYHYIHRLLAIHYIPNPDNKLQVDHINRNRADNRIENLRWVSWSENQQNKNKQKNNSSGITNISYIKRDRDWVYSKTTNGKLYTKRFKTMDEAIAHKLIREIFIKYE